MNGEWADRYRGRNYGGPDGGFVAESGPRVVDFSSEVGPMKL